MARFIARRVLSAVAKELVKASGYNTERITFVTTRDYPYMYNSAVVISDALKKVADPNQFDLFVSDFMKRPVPIAYTYLTPTYAGTTNDPGLTAAIDEVNGAKSQAEGLKDMEAVQTAHYGYVPAIKLGDIRAITAQRKSVSGFISFISPVFYGSSKS